MPNRSLILSTPSRTTSLQPPNSQGGLSIPEHPRILALMGRVPNLGLDLHLCKDRCGNIAFDILAPTELPDKVKEHGELFMNIRAQLRTAVIAHLNISPDDQGARQRISEFEQALYYKTREELHRTAQIQRPFRPVSRSKSFADDQLYCLLVVLRAVDKTMRKVDEADLPAFEACCKISAMRWQIDIHKHWITELTGERERQNRDDEEATSYSHKNPKTTSVKSKRGKTLNTQKRRPGRPAGSRNKATVAVEAQRHLATATRDRVVELPATPTPAPRMRSLPGHSQHQEHHPNNATQHVTPSPASQLPSTPTNRLTGQYSPQPGLQHFGLAPPPTKPPTNPMLGFTSRRRGAFSQQERPIDLDVRQQVEELPSLPQVYIDPIFHNYYSSLDQRGRQTPYGNGWVKGHRDENPLSDDQKSD